MDDIRDINLHGRTVVRGQEERTRFRVYEHPGSLWRGLDDVVAKGRACPAVHPMTRCIPRERGGLLMKSRSVVCGSSVIG